jgi:hypothetical protein
MHEARYNLKVIDHIYVFAVHMFTQNIVLHADGGL